MPDPSTALLFCLLLMGPGDDKPTATDAPPARALLLELTSAPRLAGTRGSKWSAGVVTRHLLAAGFEVEWDEREVLLSLPRRLELLGHEGIGDAPCFLQQVCTFDPDADPCEDVPQFNAWSAEGRVRASVLDAGHGLRADFERLIAADLEPEGHIALCRYGKSYRGSKVALAAEFGCVGVLLFSDPASDGAERGPVWPDGPWKPAWAAQRGSIKGTLSPPGDPTTPGWPSPAPGEEVHRLSGPELAARLPKIPCLPIPASVAAEFRSRLALVALGEEEEPAPVGPGPVQATLDILQPRELRTIRNVIATLPGEDDSAFVLAGNHRDSWVRGANDAGGGTVALLRAAQRLGERARGGWIPRHTIRLAFWDAEETGLFGSTEWAEANGDDLRARCIAYINVDVGVSGASFQRASGSPGMLGVLVRTLAEVTPADPAAGASLLEEWRTHLSGREPRLGLVGAGSDYASFCHHVGVPVLDLGLSGASGGQYHTAFDDFLLIERFIDPGFRGHEKAGELFAALLARLAEEGFSACDEGAAARSFGRRIEEGAWWLGAHAERLNSLFTRLGEAEAAGHGTDRIYARLRDERGLPGRPWFKNPLWAPAPEDGYSSVTFPGLRAAADAGEDELERAVELFAERLETLVRDREGAQGE